MSNELPEGWTRCRSDEACTFVQSGGTPKGKEFTRTGDVPFLKVYNLVKQRVDFAWKPQFIPHRVHSKELARSIVRPNDVLMNIVGPPLGKVAVVPAIFPEWNINQAIVSFRPSEALDFKFLYYSLLEGSEIRNLSAEFRGSAGQSNISLSQARAMPVTLSPLAEQHRIVSKVEAILTQVDAAADHLTRVPAIIKRFRQSVLAAACAGRLTEDWRAKNTPEPIDTTLARVVVRESKTGRAATDEVIPGKAILSVGQPDKEAPPGWKWMPLTDIAKLESGHTPSRKHPEYWGGKFAWIGILDAGARHGGVINDTSQTVTQAGLDNSAARLLPAGTVCLSRTASVGYVVIMGRTMATSQDFVNWVCSEALVPEFLMYALMAEGADIKRFGRGSTHTTIYFPEVKALHICLPPVEEQREIVRRIVGLLPVADDIAANVDRATQRADRITQAVLAKAFRGELVPTEADLAAAEGRTYETAEQLLARVRTEAESTSKPKAASTAG